MKQVIFSADDFGLDRAVNEAVETACRDGILTSASLMMGAEATDDAVARARALPRLKVGLHLVLVDGRPVSPPELIPALVDRQGRFRDDMAASGFRFFFRPQVQRQVATEIRAQFEAFAATGLPLDHVNAHKHFHLHPTVAGLAIRIGRRYGLAAMRVPFEPAAPIAAAHREMGGAAPANRAGARLLRLWSGVVRRMIARAGLVANDHMFGLAWSGDVTEAKISALLRHLPEGVSEIYCHPAAFRSPALMRAMPGYRHVEEFAALTSPALRRQILETGLAQTTYSALAEARGLDRGAAAPASRDRGGAAA